jgi:hypothetical protein
MSTFFSPVPADTMADLIRGYRDVTVAVVESEARDFSVQFHNWRLADGAEPVRFASLEAAVRVAGDLLRQAFPDASRSRIVLQLVV